VTRQDKNIIEPFAIFILFS